MTTVEIDIRKIEVDTSGWYYGFEPKERKVGKHKRKLNGEEYVSPRIILPSDFNNLIGKKFRLYIAEGVIKEKNWSRETEIEGTMLILFFPEKILREEKMADDFGGDWEEEWRDE